MPAPRSIAFRTGGLAALSLAIALVAVGGVARVSAAGPVTIDSIPGAPLLKLAAGHAALTFSGDADAGTTLTLQAEDIPSGTITPVCGPVTAGSDDRWTCTTASIPDYIGALQASVAGIAIFSRPLSIITAPAFSTSSTAATGSDTTPTVSGTVPVGGISTVVSVTVDSVPACTITAGPGAAWSCDVDPGLITTDGNYMIGAAQTKDFGGGESRTSIESTTSYLLDTVGPTSAATFTSPASSPHTATTTSLTLAGTAESGGTVAVVTGATTLCGPVSVTAGVWSCAAILPGPGTFTLSIVQKDSAGNLATVPSSAVVVTLAAPPVVVVVPTPSIYIPPPVSVPPIYIPAPSRTILVSTDVKIWGLNTPVVREEVTEVVINAFEALCVSLGGGTPGETIPVDQYMMVPCTSAFAKVNTSLPELQVRALAEAEACRDRARDEAFEDGFATGEEGAKLKDTFDDCFGFKMQLMIRSEPILLASATLDPTTSAMLKVELPASVPAGEHHLEFVITDPEHPDAEPVVVRMPITLVEPVAGAPSHVPGFTWWGILLIALAVAVVIAVVLLVVRRVRT